MAFTAVGSFVQTTTTTLTVNPTKIGNFYLVEVCSFSNTVYCSSISGGNCTWTPLGSKFVGSAPAPANYATVFIGKATVTGSAGATLTFSGATPTFEAAGQQFSSSVGAWALDGQGNLDTSVANSASPSLTPSGSGELYFAYAYDSGTAVGGSTPGYTYDLTSGGNGIVFNPNCGSGAQAPVWGDTGVAFGVAILLKETPRTSQPLASRAKLPAPLPPRGRIGSSRGVITPKFTGPPFYPAGVVRAKLPQQPVLRGRITSSSGAPVKNPTAGPVFRPFRQAVRIHPPKPPRGRVSFNKGGPRQNPTPLSGSILPGYVYPSFLGSYWNQFLASTGHLPQYVVLNSGNGDTPWNSDYEGLCTSLHALGITVLGYTYSSYGTRPLGTVEAAIGNYLGAGITPGGNGVDGIFIDEFQSTSGGAAYYTSLCASISSQFVAGGGSATPPIWGNPGVYLDSSYLAITAMTSFVTYEGNVANYLRNPPYNVSVTGTPNSGTAYNRSKFTHIVYGVARDQVDGVVDRGYANYAGYVYTTNTGGESNPYYVIPGNDYLNDLVSRVNAEPVQFQVGIPPYIYPQQSPARIHPSLPKRGRTHKNPGAPVSAYPVPAPAASTLFVATPGVMVPGAIWPGNPFPFVPFRFIGHYPVYYLDYLDGTTRETLYAQPGGSYFILVANTRLGLTIPPDDGRWLGEAPQQDEVPLHRKMFLKLRRHIHRSRRRSGYRNPPGDAG